MDDRPRLMTRRKVIVLAAAAPLPFMVSCSDDDDGEAAPTSADTAPGGETAVPTSPASTSTTTPAQPTLTPTPQCTDEDDDVTISQTEGPFYSPDTPERTTLREPGMAGTPLLLTGQVLSTTCAPVAGALIDFWQCDDDGEYDNVGFRLRGHQFCDADGSYTLDTILPGVYPGRTRHIHVKVQAPNRPVLTTQLYFPDEPQNATDGIFDPSLIMDLSDGPDGKRGAFTFVLEV